MFYLGMDVAKAKLDCVLLDPVTQKRKSKTVINTKDGLLALHQWLRTGIRALYKRLLENGKSRMSALGAAMRKLAHLCFGVVHSGKPYNPELNPKKA